MSDHDPDADDAKPTGPVPQAHEHAQGENMTNGVPDQTHGESATALPHGEREQAETAAGRPGPDGDQVG